MSAVTGGPIPVVKQAGDTVLCGTINRLGGFDMIVTLAQIVKLTEDVQSIAQTLGIAACLLSLRCGHRRVRSSESNLNPGILL